MTEITVSEKHTTETKGIDQATVDINVKVSLPYNRVKNIEVEIYKFVETLKKVGSVITTLPSLPYSDDEKKVIRSSTRENVWDKYHEAFPKSTRTRGGVISAFKKWKQYVKENPKSEVVGETVNNTITPPQFQDTPIPPVPKDPAPEPTPELTTWQRKFIFNHGSDENIIIKFRKKWPGVTVSSEIVTKVLSEGIIGSKPCNPAHANPAESPAIPEKPGVTSGRFKINDRVIQISGVAPAHGTGIVQSVDADGTMRVKFLSSIKVLHMDHFALAIPEKSS